jgi:hypothetical protein
LFALLGVLALIPLMFLTQYHGYRAVFETEFDASHNSSADPPSNAPTIPPTNPPLN